MKALKYYNRKFDTVEDAHLQLLLDPIRTYDEALDPVNGYKLKALLEQYSKQELLELAKFYDLDFSLPITSEQLILVMEEGLPEKIIEKMCYLSLNQLEMYEKIIKYGSVPYALFDAPYKKVKLSILTKKLMILPSLSAYDKVPVLLAALPENIELAMKILDFKQIKKRCKDNQIVIQLLKGILYYYGILSVPNCVEIINCYIHGKLVENELVQIMEYANLEEPVGEVKGNILIHYGIRDFQQVLEGQNRHSIPYKKYGKKDLLEAGNVGFYPTTNQIKDTYHFLNKHFHMSKLRFRQVMVMVLGLFDEHIMIDDIYEHLSASFECSDESFIKQFKYHLEQIEQNHRRWELKGYTPLEINVRR